jgi:hypothetical protein
VFDAAELTTPPIPTSATRVSRPLENWTGRCESGRERRRGASARHATSLRPQPCEALRATGQGRTTTSYPTPFAGRPSTACFWPQAKPVPCLARCRRPPLGDVLLHGAGSPRPHPPLAAAHCTTMSAANWMRMRLRSSSRATSQLLAPPLGRRRRWQGRRHRHGKQQRYVDKIQCHRHRHGQRKGQMIRWKHC